MKRVLFLVIAFLCAWNSAAVAGLSIVEERDELFMLAVLSYLHINIASHPKQGHEIAALIAWEVEDVEHTPEFVIDVNQNFERQGNIFHAEIMAIQKAVLKKYNFNVASTTSARKECASTVRSRLSRTTLYSSLEPCPLCTMAISWSGIPRTIYFMQDPWMCDPETHTPLINFPSEFYLGKKVTAISRSLLPLALREHLAIEALKKNLPEQYVTLLPNGKKAFAFSTYFEVKKFEFFKAAHEQFCSYKIQHTQNRELFHKLQSAIG